MVVLQLTSSLRIRVATVLLAVVCLWPPVQHLLSRSLELDPWSFFGFAMYSVPNLRVTVRAGALDPMGGEPDWNAISVASYPLLREFGERRARFGRLVTPDELAGALLERHPQLSGVVVRIQRWRISPETSRLEPEVRDFSYRASSGAGASRPR